MAGTVQKGVALLATVMVAAVAVPAVASAADRYVDAETGVDSGALCASSAPCDTVAYAISISNGGDRILVDNGSYPESVTLGGGRSLEAQDFVAADGNGPAILDGGASAAVTVPASGAGRIYGLTIRSNAGGQVVLDGTAEVASNGFDDPDADGTVVGVQVNSGADGSNIHDNTFVDPAPTTTHGRLAVYSPFTPVTIAGNTIQNQSVALQVGLNNPGQTVVAGNEITGTHSLPFAGQGILTNVSGGGEVVVRANEISDSATSDVIGITANGNVKLERNSITEQNIGVSIGNNQQGATLTGDRLWANGQGLRVFDTGAGAPKAAATATNITAVDNTADVTVVSSDLTLDSSIVETLSFSGTAACIITYSRADATGTDASGCNTFQSTAAPQFVDAPNGDFHLAPGSPMIDVGNPADPGAGALDFDGDARAIDATPACSGNVERRDIGADEFAPVPLDCSPPETAIDSGPADGGFISYVTPTFTFSSEPNATFECSLDGEAFRACSGASEDALGPLGDGDYTFAVRATDEVANTDLTPASRGFTVDTVAPETTITSGPKKRTAKRVARFAWAAEDASPTTFQCALDGAPLASCGATKVFRGVSRGRHRVRVRAIDAAGNPDVTLAKRSWRVVRKR